LNSSDVKKERLEIIMDIEWRENWVFHTQSGALRRVLMNLFCNSLKYTDAGWVKVSLQAEDITSASNESQKSKVTITISDSGRGISEEFLHGNLFTPFMQSDPMNPGKLRERVNDKGEDPGLIESRDWAGTEYCAADCAFVGWYNRRQKQTRRWYRSQGDFNIDTDIAYQWNPAELW